MPKNNSPGTLSERSRTICKWKTHKQTYCAHRKVPILYTNVNHKPFSLYLRSFCGLFKFVFGNLVNTFLHMVNNIRSSIPDPDLQSLTLKPDPGLEGNVLCVRKSSQRFEKGFPPTFWPVWAMFAILSFGSISVCFGSNWAINNYSLKSRWIVAVDFTDVRSHYSPRLKKVIVFVYTHEVISTKSERKPLKSTIWLTDKITRKFCRIFKHGNSQVYHFANNSVMA